MKIPLEISARHVHLCAADLEILFGAGYALTFVRALSQPGEFLSGERVRLVGPKAAMDSVAILGPLRPRSQAEVTLTDCMRLGVLAPVRESGDVSGSAPIVLEGPAGNVSLQEGLIVAKRHIHMTPPDARAFGVCDKQIVRVEVPGSRSLCFGDVVVRVRDTFALAMHIDTDEANAAGVGRNDALLVDIVR